MRIEQFRVEADVRHGCVAASRLLVGPLASAETVEVRVLQDNAPALAFCTAKGSNRGRESCAVYLQLPQSI